VSVCGGQGYSVDGLKPGLRILGGAGHRQLSISSLAGATADAVDGDQAGFFVHGVEDAVEAGAEAVVAGHGATAGAGGMGIRLQGVEGLVDSL